MKKLLYSFVMFVLLICASNGAKGQIVGLGCANNQNDTIAISNSGWRQLEVFEMGVYIEDTFNVSWVVPGFYCDSVRVTFSPQMSSDTATIDTINFQQRATGIFILRPDFYTVECWAWSDSCFNQFFGQDLVVMTNASGVNDQEEGRVINHICTSTGIGSSIDANMVLYPNPAQSGELVRLKCEDGDEIFFITVSDLTGRVVKCLSSNDMGTIATDCLSAGMYYVTIETKNGVVTRGKPLVVR